MYSACPVTFVAYVTTGFTVWSFLAFFTGCVLPFIILWYVCNCDSALKTYILFKEQNIVIKATV